MVIVLMGVSGSGKTSIGSALAEKTGWLFLEGDTFHPAENIEKMAGKIPLTDKDRKPWLEKISEKISSLKEPAIIACSALKKSYRELLKGGRSDVIFIYLKNPEDLLEKRIATRSGHFMPPELLKSQLETLEEPAEDEAFTVYNTKSVDDVADEILKIVKNLPGN